MITLFPHQAKVVSAVRSAWDSGKRNVMAVLPTGAGKTLVKAEFARQAMLNNQVCIVFAHRDVLLSQISEALCLMGVRHSFISSKGTIRNITNMHMSKFGKSFYDETSPVVVASVPTFSQRINKGLLDHLAPVVSYWLEDEAHHMLEENQWGKCVAPLVNAHGLGVTASPLRADGKGLGRGEITGYEDAEPIFDANGLHTGYEEPKPIKDNDGVYDELIVGATMGELMVVGRLCPYKIYIPPTKLDVTGMGLTSSGDYNQRELAKRTDKSDITGDAVEHYLRLAAGKQAITFCVNIAHSQHVADEFNKAGIVSKAVSSKTPEAEREQAIVDFRAGRIMNLVNADLFSEGFDVPAVVVCIMLRKTASYSLFKQQFGRMLRVLEGKEFGILIDHVGNVRTMMKKYGLLTPHDDPDWSLERRCKTNGSSSNEPTGRVCPECASFYIPREGNYVCSDCGHMETPAETNAAQQEFQAEEGVLVEMPVEFIEGLMEERRKVDKDPQVLRNAMNYGNAPPMVVNSAVNNHMKRQYAQTVLREQIQEWCMKKAAETSWDIKTIQVEFHRVFGTNIFKAQVLSERLAIELTEKIKND